MSHSRLWYNGASFAAGSGERGAGSGERGAGSGEREDTLLENYEPLTGREWEVAVLAAEGRVNKEVATELGLSPATVKSYLDNIYAKLGIHGRVELAKWVWERQERGG